MSDIIVLMIICSLLFGAIRYMINEKKRGVVCIGCSSSTCSQTSCESMKDYYKKVK